MGERELKFENFGRGYLVGVGSPAAREVGAGGRGIIVFVSTPITPSMPPL